MRFKVVMREIELPRSNNPFKPISIMGTLRRREATISANSEDEVRKFFADAQRRKMPSVVGFELTEIIPIESKNS